MPVRLRPLTIDDDLAPLLAIQHGQGVRPAWSPGYLREQLTDVGRERGANVRVAIDGARVRGAAGWVEGGATWYAAPVIADDAAVAGALYDDVIARARAAGAGHVRSGAAATDDAKRAALTARGFAIALGFETLVRATADGELPPVPADLREVMPRDAAVATLVALHNEAFDGVDNSRPVDEVEARAFAETAWPAASRVWLAPDGRAAAMMIAARDRDHGDDHDHATVDMIAVAGHARRRGLGARLLVRTAILAARAGVPELRALIATTNSASLALHHAAGFARRWRRDMWQLDL